MKKITLFAMTIGLAFSAAATKTVNVFFAGGQSNAKSTWASAIASGLQAGYGSTLVMVNTTHSGEGLANWFTTTAQANYTNDFWNSDGTGALQSQLRAITNAGDNVVFQGIFWFQGETDTGSYASMDAYTNRVALMVAKLKQDLGMTNSVRFTYAVIDGNPDPFYDNPTNSGGRTRADINYLRAYQSAQGSQAQFAYVDTRGYTRTDMWHLTTTELTRLGTAMSAAYTTKFGTSLPPDETVYVSSHGADGSIWGTTGVFPDSELITGVSSGNFMYNGIAFFQLPNSLVSEANLLLTVSSGGTLTNANIDVWALGYMSVPAMSASWLLQADTDSRVLLNSLPPTKIADNLVPVNQATIPGNVFQLNAAQRTNLTAYINALYARGAQSGDYVVIRTNPDAVMNTSDLRSIRFGSSTNATTAYRPKLAVTLSNTSVLGSGFKYYSHPKDGAIYATGAFDVQDLISATGGNGPQDFNGIAFLPLPEQPMTSSSLSLTALSQTGIMTNANIDVWGLGYMPVPQMSADWFCTNNTDSRVLLNGRQPVKLADNIVTSGQTVAVGYVWQPTAVQTNELRKYLNRLYDRGDGKGGAKPGDYAVIRVNMDASQAGFNRGVRWGGSSATSPERRATLSGNFPSAFNYLVNDGFESGSGSTPSIWTVASNGFKGVRTNETARNGGYSFKMSVNGSQVGNTNDNLNIYQDVISSDLHGKIVTLSGYVRHNSSEPFTNANQKVEFKMQWLYEGSQGAIVTCSDPLLPTDPKDAYKAMIVAGAVPTNAIGVRAQVVFSTGTVANPAVTNGAALVDDLRLTVFVPPPPTGTLLLFR